MYGGVSERVCSELNELFFLIIFYMEGTFHGTLLVLEVVVSSSRESAMKHEISNFELEAAILTIEVHTILPN